MSDKIQRLREVAEAATEGLLPGVSDGRRFNPRASTDGAADAEHIATFDPPTVLELLDRLERAEAAVERVRELAVEWNWTASLPPSTYQAIGDVLEALDGGER